MATMVAAVVVVAVRLLQLLIMIMAYNQVASQTLSVYVLGG